MPLEHDDASRFTPEQRDAILNLAARLQVDHEATVGVDELSRAAEEAGIDPRFVQQAALALSHRGRTASADSIPLVAFSTLVAQVVLYFYLGHLSLNHGGMARGILNATGAFTAAFLLAAWGSQEKRLRRFVPLAPIVAWVTITTPVFLLTRNTQEWVVPFACFFGLVQTIAAFAGTLIVASLDRGPKDAKSFHLDRS